MADMGALRVRLGAVGVALRGLVGTEQHESMSRVQANAIVAMLNRGWANLSFDDKSALAMLVSNIDWYTGHDMPILAILARDAPDASSANSRNAQQKYTSFVEFLTEDTWSNLLPADGDVPPSNACLNIIIQRMRVHDQADDVDVASHLRAFGGQDELFPVENAAQLRQEGTQAHCRQEPEAQRVHKPAPVSAR